MSDLCSKNVGAPCQNEAVEVVWVRERGPLWNGRWQPYPRCAGHPAADDVAMISRVHPMAETRVLPAGQVIVCDCDDWPAGHIHTPRGLQPVEDEEADR